MAKQEDKKILIAQNKKALRDFFILDRFESGIVLMGSEVKSIRENKVNLKDCYARIKDKEIYLYNMHISPYSKGRIEDINPRRTRKLLMHRKEINRIMGKLVDRSLTLVPLKI
jgi:SsrA-binding protein